MATRSSAHSTSSHRDPQGGEAEAVGRDEGVEVTEGSTEGATGEARKPDGTFTSESARKAVLVRWERQRQREADGAEALGTEIDPETRLVAVPVSVGLVIRRLDKDARGGSTQAARELRAWLDQYPPQDEGFDPSVLERTLRVRLYARLMAEEEGTAEGAQAETPAKQEIR